MKPSMFLKLDGIDGESEDAEHKNEIDILSWSWGMSQSANTHMGGGGGVALASVQDLSATKWVDKSSPIIQGVCLEGKHLKDAVLVCHKAGDDGKALKYLTIKMHDVIVSSYSTGGSGAEGRLTENFSLNFSKVEFEYVKQSKTGGADAKPKLQWDIKQGKGSAG
ncbi:MAG: type VI secretion system tube protein Hcp [Pseudomonadota bacterium]